MNRPPLKVRTHQKGSDISRISDQWFRFFCMKPWISPAIIRSVNMITTPTSDSQNCHDRREFEYHSRFTTRGHSQSSTPNSQKVKVPYMIMCACPTTQSVKWITFWNIQVTWKAHWKQVMKYITAPA